MENTKSKYDNEMLDIHDNIYSETLQKFHHLYKKHASSLNEDVEYLDAITARYGQPFYEITLGLIEPDNPIKVSILCFEREYEQIFFHALLKHARTTHVYAWILGFEYGSNGKTLNDGHGLWEFQGKTLKVTDADLNQLVEYSTALINMKLSDLHKSRHINFEQYSYLVNYFLNDLNAEVVMTFLRGFEDGFPDNPEF